VTSACGNPGNSFTLTSARYGSFHPNEIRHHTNNPKSTAIAAPARPPLCPEVTATIPHDPNVPAVVQMANWPNRMSGEATNQNPTPAKEGSSSQSQGHASRNFPRIRNPSATARPPKEIASGT